MAQRGEPQTEPWSRRWSRDIDLGSRGLYARMATVVMGIWLYLTAFLSSQRHAARLHMAVCGALIACLSVGAAWLEPLRWAVAGVALWLLCATLLVFRMGPGPGVNVMLIGLLIVLLSVMPRLEEGAQGHGRVRTSGSA